MATIRLERGAWNFSEGDRLGAEGGFGEVFRGDGPDGEVAIKRLKLTADAAAHREMRLSAAIADRTHSHVVPVLDYGRDDATDRYYLVMPVCDESLQDFLNREGAQSAANVKSISMEIITGLEEVGDIVHRDLKPANILKYDERWCVADFGIAKFVEDSTSLQTLRESLTPLYGAPEQWLNERPTHATDVYALGCIIHTILRGAPPFTGDLDAVRDAHLHKAPPALESDDVRLNALVHHMLRKPMESRPTLDRCATVIRSTTGSAGRRRNSALAEAGQHVAQQQAEAEARANAEATLARQRQQLGTEACGELRAMFDRLFDEIEAEADSARRERLSVTLGPAILSFVQPETGHPPRPQSLQTHHTDATWDVAAHSEMTLRASNVARYNSHESDTYSFSATLAFAATPSDPSFRWREVGFWAMRDTGHDYPAALSPFSQDFHFALGNVMHVWNVAYGPFTIDGEDEPDFQDRWLHLFAKAARSQLRRSMNMPVPASYFAT